MAMSHPKVVLGALPDADGSASYSWHGFDVVGAVNGPIEVQRRDELPEEAYIEVNVRPANGTGGTRERHIESLITFVLRSIILTKLHPRTLIQITLQLLATPEAESSSAAIPQYASHLPSLPHLLHTALLALVNGNIPLTKTFTAALIGIDEDNGWGAFPSIDDCAHYSMSSHVFVNGSKGETLLLESEGEFDVDGLDKATSAARQTCEELQVWLVQTLEQGVKKANQWREHL